ncbi:MAG: hypothetical protein ACYTGP_04360 [Planctomycetota bacterium]|jgi:hypothetical protein
MTMPIRTHLTLPLVAAMLLAGFASGQGHRAQGDAFKADFRPADLNLFVRELKLDDNRKAVVEALLFDYEAAFAKAVETVRGQLDEINPPPSAAPDELRADQEALRREVVAHQSELRRRLSSVTDPDERRAIMDEYHARIRALRDEMRAGRAEQQAPAAEADPRLTEVMTAWGLEKRRLRDELIGNVEAVLTAEQKPRWPGLQRTLRRREMSLGRGYLSGETVDLVKILGTSRADAETMAALVSVVEDYAIILDQALVARNDVIAGTPANGVTPEQVDAMLAARTKLRDVNVQYAARIGEALPDTFRTGFVREYHLAAFPTIFRPTPVQRLFESTLKRQGLDPSLAQEIESLHREYLRELAVVNDVLRETTIRHEAEQLGARMRRTVHRGPVAPHPGITDDPIRDAMADRRQLGATYSDRLKTLMGDTASRSAGARGR